VRCDCSFLYPFLIVNGCRLPNTGFLSSLSSQGRDGGLGYQFLIQATNLTTCPGSCIRPVGLAFGKDGRLYVSSDTSGEVSSLSVLFLSLLLSLPWSMGFNTYCYVSLPYSFEFNAKYTNSFVASIALRHRECLKNAYLTRSVPRCPQLPLSSTWKMWSSELQYYPTSLNETPNQSQVY
jgi:hypothetical protein